MGDKVEHERNEEMRYIYDLADEEMAALTAELLEERPPSGDERFVCYMLDGSNPEDMRYTNVARTIECRVFTQVFNDDAGKMKSGYGDYEKQSIFFLSVDRDASRATGELRAIRDGPKGLKTLNDLCVIYNNPHFGDEVIEHYDLDPRVCWDVGTAGVLKEYKGGGPLLYRAVYVASQHAGIKHFLAVIDAVPFEAMKFLGFPFEAIHGTDWGPYMGSKRSLPVYGDAPAFERAVQKQEQSITDENVRKLAQSAFNQVGYGSRDDALQF